jgi:hypothetical protein
MTGFSFYQNQILAEIYQEERLREAEMDRLARLALANTPKGSNRICTVLFWLGKQMVHWGMHLQKQYAPTTLLPNGVNRATG